ncbi:hypothetical protein GCM10023350_52620 [Nocardioides endophyticus]|uniref:Uncharacterized protein n=1 Tax=Nocardioides endophyticus TaxID=1353775 RepID=A0ABP8ZLS8_9ACTN
MGHKACTITVDGELDDRFHDAFTGFTTVVGDGKSELSGSVADQAELQGLLRRLYDLGLTVISFQVDP